MEGEKQLTPSLNFDVSSAYEEIICETWTLTTKLINLKYHQIFFLTKTLNIVMSFLLLYAFDLKKWTRSCSIQIFPTSNVNTRMQQQPLICFHLWLNLKSSNAPDWIIENHRENNYIFYAEP